MSTVLRASPPPQAARPIPRGVRLRVTRPHRLGFPVLRWISVYRHAVVITPVARWVLIARGADYSNRFPFIPSDGGLPHPIARSASTLVVSRPAQRSLALYAFRQFHAPLEIYGELQTVLIVSMSSRTAHRLLTASSCNAS